MILTLQLLLAIIVVVVERQAAVNNTTQHYNTNCFNESANCSQRKACMIS